MLILTASNFDSEKQTHVNVESRIEDTRPHITDTSYLTSSTSTGGLLKCLRSVILRNLSGYARGITQYIFGHLRERALLGVLLP